jgi:Ca2+-binding RTX toxin-like protein
MPFFTGTSFNDTLDGGDLSDSISASAGLDIVTGGGGYDTIFGGDDNDLISGLAEDDLLYGDGGNDTVNGGDGNDTIFGGNGDDLINGDAGNDRLLAGSGADTLLGGDGNDFLGVEAPNDNVQDVLKGEAGDDTIGVATGDSADGGEGNDAAYLVLRFLPGGGIVSTANMSIDLSQSDMNAVASTLIDATVVNFERWGVITGSGADTVIGSSTGDFINVDLGNALVSGGDGNDTIVHGGGGTALLTGGDGSDVFRFGRPAATEGDDTITDFARGIDHLDFDIDATIVQVDLIDTDGDSAADDTRIIWRNETTNTTSRIAMHNIQLMNLITTGTDLLLIETGVNTTINGLEGNDTIRGNSGSDQIFGGLGNDYLKDGVGADLLDGGDGNDTLVGSGLGNAISTQDTLRGGDGNDFLFGLAGNDILDGGQGGDYMSGGDGNDLYFVDDANDIVFEQFTFEAKDKVSASVSFYLRLGVEDLELTGTDNLTGIGNDTANVITGNSGANLLRGADGDDRLIGAGGNDTVLGDNGNDTLQGGAGVNILNGGEGVDVADLRGSTAGIFLYPMTLGGGATIQLGDNTLTSIEIISAFGEGNDTVVGSQINVILDGSGGNDFMLGMPIPDGFSGGTGSDTLIGGDSDDKLYGYSSIVSSSDPLTTPDVDYLYGGNGNDFMRGGLGLSVLIGEQGNDTLVGNGATSYLFSGAGNNLLSSDAQLSVILSEGTSDSMDSSRDAYYYRLADGTSTVRGGNGVDQFIGGNANSNDSVEGNGGNDFMFGGNGGDLLNGGAGNDVLIGQNGNDTLYGGSGVNLLWANDSGSDQVLVNVFDGGTQVVEFFEAGGTNDIVRLLGSSLTSFAGYEVLKANIGGVVGNNLLVNASSGAQLYLNLGANQTAIWFQGVSAYSLTSSDFLFG